MRVEFDSDGLVVSENHSKDLYEELQSIDSEAVECAREELAYEAFEREVEKAKHLIETGRRYLRREDRKAEEEQIEEEYYRKLQEELLR